MLSAEGVTDATKYAILNANYIKERLNGHYDTLYGEKWDVAHEMILECSHSNKKVLKLPILRNV